MSEVKKDYIKKPTEKNKKIWSKTLRNVADAIDNDKFIGVIAYSNVLDKKGKSKAFALGNKGAAEDRIMIMDFIFEAILSEKECIAKQYMVSEIYKRFKHYFGQMYEAERVHNINKDKEMIV